MELPAIAELVTAPAIDQHQAAAVLEAVNDLRDELASVTRMRVPGALPMAFSHDVVRIWKQQARHLPFPDQASQFS
ncbi:hypothetical protein D3C80_1529030 [compost metagenome]